jgi:hypothetical protein
MSSDGRGQFLQSTSLVASGRCFGLLNNRLSFLGLIFPAIEV